ncbi:RNA polymerase III RPC4-domain-containing protein [Xylariaceae sp. FL1272]|nr:RNA polymerase III RPC4-domain-containing protein [Xylariaceae sp. FL1272]
MAPGMRGGESSGAARGARGGRGRGRGASSATRSQAQETNTGDVQMQDAMPSATPSAAASEAPPTGRSTPTAATTSSSASTSARGTSRFKPKNIRRDEAERKKLEDDRNRDLATKIKTEEREQRQENRRRGRGRGRGRGDLPRGLIRRDVVSSGPFSAFAIDGGSGRGAWASGGWSGDGGNPVNGEYGDRLRYAPRREHEPRVNIDLLNGLTDGYAEDGTPLYHPDHYLDEQYAASLPVGMLRTRHEEVEVKIKTQAELEKEDQQESDDEDLFVAKDARSAGPTDANAVWNAPMPPQNHVSVKAEPGTGQEGADIAMADIPAAPKAPDSPELKKKLTIDVDGTAIDPEIQEKKQKKAKDDPEFAHRMNEAQHMLNMLQFTATATAQDEEEEIPKLFFFQFPPLLPPLNKPSTGQSGAIDVDAIDENNSNVKVEEAHESANFIKGKQTGVPAEGGYVGRLNVRKSGKVELDWGGMTMRLGTGTPSDFLTHVMVVDLKDSVESAQESAGTAYSMGEIKGKFTVGVPLAPQEDWEPEMIDPRTFPENGTEGNAEGNAG